MDCGAAARIFLNLWRSGLAGRIDESAKTLWVGHAKGCSCCRDALKGLATLAGLEVVSAQPVRVIQTVKRNNQPCMAILDPLGRWMEAAAVKAPGTTFEPTLGQHLCGCYGCRQMFDLFGELELFFDEQK